MDENERGAVGKEWNERGSERIMFRVTMVRHFVNFPFFPKALE